MKWNDDLIRSSINDAMKKLNINRMPTGDELKNIGMNSLHCKISRTKKYSGWATELCLDLKSGSETRRGTTFEQHVVELLKKNNLTSTRMSHKHPYDLMVESSVKVDVKVSSPYVTKHGTKYIFAGMKGDSTCDVYVFVCLDLNDNVTNTFVIPSHKFKQHSVNFKENSYPEYLNNFNILKRYRDFHNSV